MIKVENKKVITIISHSAFRENKLINIFAIIAIMLTTIMFTTLFTIGMSMIDSMEESTMRQVGGSTHGSFKYLSQEEFKKLKTHPSIKDVEHSIFLGIAENQELKKRSCEIRYATDEQAKWMFSNPTTGKMPENSNEIAMDTIVLDYLNIPYELGQKVTLDYTLGSEKINETFTLVGYWEDDKVMPASQVFISKEYLDTKLSTFVPDEDNKSIGTITADIMFKNTFDVEGKLKQIIEDSGYDKNEIQYGVNWAYTMSSGDIDFGVILATLGGLLLVMFSGYLIIYNIFYISISKDIRFYGLLKTIGTTSKQIVKIIRNQAMKLCLIGIPCGLILGYLIGAVMTPMILEQFNLGVMNTSINPIIFIASTIFATITVFISTNKPSKIAGKVSPIEALRTAEVGTNSKINFKKSKRINLRKMALSNVFRNTKKATIVTISLSLSLIILNSTYSIVKGFDMDTFLSKMISTDFVIADAGYFNISKMYMGEAKISNKFLKNLSSQNKIEEIGNIQFSENQHYFDKTLKENINKLKSQFPDYFASPFAIDNKDFLEEEYISSHIYGLDKMSMETLQLLEDNLDYEKFKSGNYVIVSSFDEKGKGKYYNIGDKVNLTSSNGYNKEYEVMAIANIKHNLGIRHGHFVTPDFFIPSEEFTLHSGDSSPMLTIMNVDDKYEVDVENWINNYCENINTDMDYESKLTYVEEFESTKNMYMSVGTVLSFILAFIGIMNFINTMITSVISRRHELAMLQSIGMTSRQINTMMIWEGLTYALLTTCFTLTIGSIISYLGVNAIVSSIWFFKYKFTIMPILLCLPVLFILSLIVPSLCYRFASKDSIIERLRIVE